MRAVAVYCDRLILQRLNDEIRDHATIIGMHAGPVRIKNPRDLDVDPVLPIVVKKQCLSASLALVVAGANTNRVDVAPLALFLGMNFGVAVDLTCRCLENFGSSPFR